MTSFPSYRRQLSLARWIFFDLDDTLWDFSANSDAALRYLFRSSDILKSAYTDYESFAGIYHRHNDRLWKDFAAGKVDAETLKCLRFSLTLDEAGVHTDDQVIKTLNKCYLDRLVNGRNLIAGAEETLSFLQRHFLIAIISNGFKDTQYKKIYSTPLNRYITRLITSAEAGATKPNKQIFEYALQATGASLSGSLMIGDNADTDVKGAVETGMSAVYFQRHPDAGVPPVIENLKDSPLFKGIVTDLRQLIF